MGLPEFHKDCEFAYDGELVVAKLDLLSYARGHSHRFPALADLVRTFEWTTEPSLLQWFTACVPHPCVQDPVELRWALWREWRRRHREILHSLNFTEALPTPWPADFTVRLSGGPADGSCWSEPYTFKPCCLLNVHACWHSPFGKIFSFGNCCVFRRFDGQDNMLPLLAAGELTVEVFGRPVTLRQQGGGQQYWTPGHEPSLTRLSPKMLWQGSYAIARWLEDAADLPCSALRGQGVRMVELGTGMGLGAIAARLLGVPHVTAIDVDKNAIDLARINAEGALGKTGMAGLEFLQLDWGNVSAQARSGVWPPGLRPAADVVIGGAVGGLVDHSSFETLLKILKPSGVALFAERWQEFNLGLARTFFEVETVADAHARRYVAAVYKKSPMRLYRLRPKRR